MPGAALECNAILRAMPWLLGSYKPVTRWINDTKVASINMGRRSASYVPRILVKLLTWDDDNRRPRTATDTVNDFVAEAKVE